MLNREESLLPAAPEEIAYDHFSGMPPLERLFSGAGAPLEVEIGCGKGKFLLARAGECPGINFLGVDRVKKWMKRGILRGTRRRLTNVKFVKAEIRAMMAEYFPPESVDVFHVYFPDPWPKRRHQKRRLVSADFLSEVHGKLKPGGLLEIATDHADYFESMLGALDGTRSMWRSVRESRNQRLFCETAKTNYELKYESRGKILYYLEMQK